MYTSCTYTPSKVSHKHWLLSLEVGTKRSRVGGSSSTTESKSWSSGKHYYFFYIVWWMKKCVSIVIVITIVITTLLHHITLKHNHNHKRRHTQEVVKRWVYTFCAATTTCYSFGRIQASVLLFIKASMLVIVVAVSNKFASSMHGCLVSLFLSVDWDDFVTTYFSKRWKIVLLLIDVVVFCCWW
jgi:hypothetical protein